MPKPLIAIVTGIANGFAEQELLRGIIAENQKNGYSTVVFSNIYNIVQEDAYLECERRIYELVYSQDVSGVILFCESFVEERARRAVASMLQKATVPVIGIGSDLSEFAALSIPCLNTDDVQELEELTDHLIDVHGFTDILMLTGMREVEVSHQRVKGYEQSLIRHGIDYDPDKVIFGDFWTTSGEKLADSLIRGERPIPQAILCANDHMAYGLLRRFSEAGIAVPEEVTVVAYEYSDHRMYYSPPLTCCRRDREALGRAAAVQMHCLISGMAAPTFVPPKGSMVYGASCPCPMNERQMLTEQRDAAERRNYYDLNLFSTMEYRLTLCRDMTEFIRIIGDHVWMIRNERSMYLRLFADWYDPDTTQDGLMQSRCILPWEDTSIFENDRYDLQTLFEREPGAAVCYYTPVFSGNRLFGDMAVLYDTPDGYDDVFRHWLKSVSIGLEFLRLKNDIHYLLSCQTVSEYRDTLTGLYNERGLKRAFSARSEHEEASWYCVMLRLFLFPYPVSEADISQKTDALLGASKIIGSFCGRHDFAGRTRKDTFVCFVRRRAEAEQLSDLLYVMLLREKRCISYLGTDGYACTAVRCDTASYDEMLHQCESQITASYEQLKDSRKNRYYQELIEIRNLIYATPELTFTQDDAILPEDRTELYRSSYKKCFGITFHQDCITARIAKAKYYLAATQLELADISEKCGYLDHKYFQRQFTAVVGMPALQYRSLFQR
ncbi:MAG: substrate-binding domain-containing protein [Oscillospiraceae bacterium]|nr:substrate-binding domain-containing protein [Oscillospiraceae bacterium]